MRDSCASGCLRGKTWKHRFEITELHRENPLQSRTKLYLTLLYYQTLELERTWSLSTRDHHQYSSCVFCSHLADVADRDVCEGTSWCSRSGSRGRGNWSGSSSDSLPTEMMSMTSTFRDVNSEMNSPKLKEKTISELTGAAFGGTKPSISFLVMRPSGPEPEQKTAQCTPHKVFYHHSSACSVSHAHLPLTCARSIPFSAASFLASGLANTRPFLGAAGAAAAGAGLGAGAAALQITSYMHELC